MSGIKKEVEKFVEEFLNSEEFKEEKAKLDQEAKDYIVYGTPTRYLNESLLTEIKNYDSKKREA
jgi:hypothetical protein